MKKTKLFFYSLFTTIFVIGCSSTPRQPDLLTQMKIEDALGKGKNLLNAGRVEAAIHEFNIALDLDPSSASAQLALAYTYFLKKNFQEALSRCEKLQKSNPHDARIYAFMGEIYMTQNKNDEALKKFEKATDLDPNQALYHFNLALLYSKKSNEKKTYQEFSRFLENPDDQKRIDYAVEWMKLNNYPIPAYEYKAATLLKERKYEELEKYLSDLVIAKEVDENQISKLRLAYDSLKKIPNHRILIQSMVDAKPKSAIANSLIGVAYLNYAWEARGDGFRTTVTTDGQRLFKERLAKAEEYLLMSKTMDPLNIETITSLLVIGRTVPYEKEKMEGLLKEAMVANPNAYSPNYVMLQYLSPKWGGNIKDMFDFVYSVAKNSGPKSKNELLIVVAHWEVVSSYYPTNPEKYFKKKVVWDEVKATLEKLAAKFPESAQIKNNYARAAYYAGDMVTAKKQFTALDGKIMPSEWWGPAEVQKVRDDLLSE